MKTGGVSAWSFLLCPTRNNSCVTEGGTIRPNLSATFPEQEILNVSLSPHHKFGCKVLH